MKNPKKFQIATSQKEGKLEKKEVVGFEVSLPFNNLKIFSCPHTAGWLTYEQKTGLSVGAKTPCATEDEAISALMALINDVGVDAIVTQINDVIKNATTPEAVPATAPIAIDKVRGKAKNK